VAKQFGAKHRFVAVQKESGVAAGEALQRQGQAIDDQRRALVSAHGVD
jgi:hypothetical protein